MAAIFSAIKNAFTVIPNQLRSDYQQVCQELKEQDTEEAAGASSPERPDGPSSRIPSPPSGGISFREEPSCRRSSETNSSASRKDILDCLEQIEKEILPNALIVHDQPRASSFNEEAQPKELAAKTRLEAAKEETNTWQPKFTESLIAYTMFHLLYEWAAGQKFSETPNDKDSYTYQSLVQQFLVPKIAPPPSIWEVFENTLGRDLNWFSKAKAYLFYKIFYDSSNFIPKLIEDLLPSILKGCREHLSQDLQRSAITSRVLFYAANYLTCMSGAIANFIKTEGTNGLLDVYQQNALRVFFTQSNAETTPAQLLILTKEKERSLIAEDSARLVDAFLPSIKFFSAGENHPFFLLQWFGTAVSSLLNATANWALRISLKYKIVPALLQSQISSNLTEASAEKAFVFGRALYRSAAIQIRKITENLEQELKKPTLQHRTVVPLDVNDEENLRIIADCCYQVFVMPTLKTPKAIKAYRENPDYLAKVAGAEPKITEGIFQGGKIAIAILQDPASLEEMFASLLQNAHESLIHDKTSESLKTEYVRYQENLITESSALCKVLLDGAVDEQTQPEQLAFKKTQAILERIKQKIAPKYQELQFLLLETISQEMAGINQLFLVHTDPLQGVASFQAIRICCGLLQDINDQLHIETIAREYHAIPDPENLEAALQPIREQLFQLAKLLKQLIPHQNTHYLCLAAQEKICMELRESLRQIEIDVQNGVLDAEKSFESFENALESIKPLLAQVNIVFEEDKLQTQLKLFAEELKELSTFQKKIHDLQLLLGDEGLVRQRLNFFQEPSSYFSRRGKARGFKPQENKEKIENILTSIFSEEKSAELLEMLDLMQAKEGVLSEEEKKEVNTKYAEFETAIQERITQEEAQKNRFIESRIAPSLDAFFGFSTTLLEQLVPQQEETALRLLGSQNHAGLIKQIQQAFQLLQERTKQARIIEPTHSFLMGIAKDLRTRVVTTVAETTFPPLINLIIKNLFAEFNKPPFKEMLSHCALELPSTRYRRL